MSDTTVYHVSLTVDETGKQVPALVYRKPEQGYAYPVGYIHVLGRDGEGSVWSPANDEGVIPHRERTSDDENLGLTWQFPK